MQAPKQPRSRGLSSLSLLVLETETLVTAGHVTTQNLGGRKICWKGGVFYCPLHQMYLSTHPPCGFGWIDGHVTSRNRVFVPTTRGGREERAWERGWDQTLQSANDIRCRHKFAPVSRPTRAPAKIKRGGGHFGVLTAISRNSA